MILFENPLLVEYQLFYFFLRFFSIINIDSLCCITLAVFQFRYKYIFRFRIQCIGSTISNFNDSKNQISTIVNISPSNKEIKPSTLCCHPFYDAICDFSSTFWYQIFCIKIQILKSSFGNFNLLLVVSKSSRSHYGFLREHCFHNKYDNICLKHRINFTLSQ